MDSTFARAHQHAAGARKGDLPAEPPSGVTVGQLHPGCAQGQKPLSIVLTAGQLGGSPQFIPVLAGIRVPG